MFDGQMNKNKQVILSCIHNCSAECMVATVSV
jgi:hypothetical protein